MSRVLALEWNDAEARLVVASLRGGGIVVEHAFGVALEPSAVSAEVNVGERIAAALAARGIGRLETLVAVGRAEMELRQLAVPPCPPEELPDLVRFQAMKEFSGLKEDWPLDFVPLSADNDPARTVLAATIDPALVEAIGKTCQPAGLKPRRLVLRPCACASLWRHSPAADDSTAQLLVDLLGDEAELTVMFDRKEVFLRSARLPNDPLKHADAIEPLVAEVRRTIGAAQNQLGGRRVESVVLCGNSDAHRRIATRIKERLALPAEGFDPLAGVKLSGDALRTPPENSGCFGALLGMARDELEHAAPAIDFLHSRKRPKPKSRRAAYVLVGAVAVVLLLAVVGYGWQARRAIRAEIAELQTESTGMDQGVAQADKVERAARDVGAWVAEDVVWLDQLRWLCEALPPTEDAMLSQLTVKPTPEGGRIDIDGFARSPDAMKKIERKLRDASHGVVSKKTGDDASQSPYSLRFSSTVVIKRETP
jgi:Tfp pilus assembly PilM family ATPase